MSSGKLSNYIVTSVTANQKHHGWMQDSESDSVREKARTKHILKWIFFRCRTLCIMSPLRLELCNTTEATIVELDELPLVYVIGTNRRTDIDNTGNGFNNSLILLLSLIWIEISYFLSMLVPMVCNVLKFWHVSLSHNDLSEQLENDAEGDPLNSADISPSWTYLQTIWKVFR